MQFVLNGPDIPNDLLREHEEGNVVFFCGAGISYPAGLQGFRGLVDKIYKKLGTTKTAIEEAAYEKHQYDTTLNLLEQRAPGGRGDVRKALKSSLRPNLAKPGATTTHEALLCLGRDRAQNLRIVTTNFDRLFHTAASQMKQKFDPHEAPFVPIPKASRWNGLVFLHGLLPTNNDMAKLNRLIVTSGDFGLAYIAERWASRFVSELFRNFTVCFVGYSVEDPVLRYMMDALAADRQLGESIHDTYVFAGCEKGKEAEAQAEWDAKNVIPILYEVPAGTHDHSILHSTLTAWADTYRDGVHGRERIVVQSALSRPSASTPQDDFVGRMLWAISDPSGLPAKRFAEYDPVPPLAWLDAFEETRFGQLDLVRFGVPPLETSDTKLKYSLVKRPAPYTHAPWMTLWADHRTAARPDDVMFQIARWLMRHLNDPDLILRVAAWGGLNETFEDLFRRRLDELATLKRDGNLAEIGRLSANAPSAIPGVPETVLWRLILAGKVRRAGFGLKLLRAVKALSVEGLTTSVKSEILSCLTPRVSLTRPFRIFDEEDSEPTPAVHVTDVASWGISLSVEHPRSLLNRKEDETWRDALPELQSGLEGKLNEALELRWSLGGGSEKGDGSFSDLPSIEAHWQNRGFREWVLLIELVRDAWLVIRDRDSEEAIRIASSWYRSQFPVYKRLALFAASRHEGIQDKVWVEWLSVDSARWLWSPDTRRETLRLLATRGATLAGEPKRHLEAAILKGPPRSMYVAELEEEKFHEYGERDIWLRLSKLVAAGTPLGEEAWERLDGISNAYPNWRLAENQRDEFNIWHSGTGDPGYESQRQIISVPRKWREMLAWLRDNPEPVDRGFTEDEWNAVCRENFSRVFMALSCLTKEGTWPERRWSTALYAWSNANWTGLSWRHAAIVVESMPENTMNEVLDALSCWLYAASSASAAHPSILIGMSEKVLRLEASRPNDLSEDTIDNRSPVTDAINHPVGHIAQAIMNYWFACKPNDGDTLPSEVESLFSKICDTQIECFQHGRVILGSQLIALYRVDPQWTEKNLLPLMDWTKHPLEAKGIWEGFLWTPRLYLPLQAAFQEQFLDTANHFERLGEHKEQYARFLTFAALDFAEPYSVNDFSKAISALPKDALAEVAHALSQALESSGEQKRQFWKNRFLPFWRNIWPKNVGLVTDRVSDSVVRIILNAGEDFPVAVELLANWIVAEPYGDYEVNKLWEAGYPSRFPKKSLEFLYRFVVPDGYPPDDLRLCLKAISDADEKLSLTPEYNALDTFLRKFDK